MLDAGNALFKGGGMGDPVNLRRAELILLAMGQLGTRAMAAGGRDLVGGVALLEGAAARSGVKVLSANMRSKEGAAVFPASTVLEAGGLRIGVVGLSPPGPVTTTPGVQCVGPSKAALAEAAALRPRTDVVVVLAAVPHADALALAGSAAGAIDFILESTERRVAAQAERHGSTWLVACGDAGKQLGTLELLVSGKGSFEDAASPAQRPPSRTFRLAFTELTAVIASDPAIEKAVVQIEPPKAP